MKRQGFAFCSTSKISFTTKNNKIITIIIIKIQNAVMFVTKWQVEVVDRVILQNPVKLQFEGYIVSSSLIPFFC